VLREALGLVSGVAGVGHGGQLLQLLPDILRKISQPSNKRLQGAAAAATAAAAALTCKESSSTSEGSTVLQVWYGSLNHYLQDPPGQALHLKDFSSTAELTSSSQASSSTQSATDRLNQLLPPIKSTHH
jgi:membrane protease subunit (stomatin/prohibitin family)